MVKLTLAIIWYLFAIIFYLCKAMLIISEKGAGANRATQDYQMH